MSEGFLDEGEVKFATVKKRAVKSVAALSGRTFLLQIVSFFGFFLLSVFLGKEEIGLFFAVSEIVAILGYFSDIGLAAALIQKKRKLSRQDIRSTFTIQEAIVLFFSSLALIFSPLIISFYNISPQGVWLFRSLVFGFFLASLKTIPSVLLERKLRFDLLVMVEVVEALLFYGFSVILAWQGWGVLSYAWAVLARGIVGVVLIYLFSPWKMGLAFKRKPLSRLLKFGVPFQANTILAVIKDRLMNVFLWKIIGVGGVGVLGWAQKWAQMPLRFAMDPVMKVTFPAFSRIQEAKEKLRQAVEFSLFSVACISWPLLAGLSLLAAPLVGMIPKYQKWEIALLPLYLFCFNAAWGAITTPLTNAFNAVGKIKVTFKLMVLWTVLTWVLTPLLAINFGFLGASWALGLIPISSIIVFWLVKKEFGVKLTRAIREPLLATFIMGAYLWLLKRWFPFVNFFCLGFAVVSGGLVYLLALFVLAKKRLIQVVNLLKNAFIA